jgi:hypothetical protein
MIQEEAEMIQYVTGFASQGEQTFFPAFFAADAPRDVIGAPRLPPGANESPMMAAAAPMIVCRIADMAVRVGEGDGAHHSAIKYPPRHEPRT